MRQNGPRFDSGDPAGACSDWLQVSWKIIESQSKVGSHHKNTGGAIIVGGAQPMSYWLCHATFACPC